MIPMKFDYYRPDTVSEAVKIYGQLDSEGKRPLYYGGGSEIISMARMNNLDMGAVIDLKGIPECRELKTDGDHLVIGSSVTLSDITEADLFPLLSKACGRIADHTMQCKITVGGNICGTIIYKEALLPLLLSDCTVLIAGAGHLKKVSVHRLFHQGLNLSPGEFIVQFLVEKKYAALPYFHIKKTKNEKIDYPLISLCAVLEEGSFKLALSGLCGFPFRSVRMETELNRRDVSPEERVRNAVNLMPGPVLNDVSGSDRYRLFVLKNTLMNLGKELEG